MAHPLDDEDIQITVSLLHRPTQTIAIGFALAPVDGPPDINDAIEQAKQEALDRLLNKLEQGGV